VFTEIMRLVRFRAEKTWRVFVCKI